MYWSIAVLYKGMCNVLSSIDPKTPLSVAMHE